MESLEGDPCEAVGERMAAFTILVSHQFCPARTSPYPLR